MRGSLDYDVFFLLCLILHNHILKSNKMKKINFLLLIMLVVSSCTNEDTGFVNSKSIMENQVSSLATEDVGDDVMIINSMEDIAKCFDNDYFIGDMKREPIPSVVRANYDDDYHAISGYTREKVFSGDQKMIFGKDLANKIGVSSTTVYICSVLKYELDIPNPQHKQLFDEDSPHCGAKPIMSDDRELVSDFQNLGYEPLAVGPNVNPNILSTHVLWVKYSFPGGSNVNRYYPRKGNDLIWIYYL